MTDIQQHNYRGKCMQYEQMYNINVHRLHLSCVVNYLMVIITEEKQLNLCSLGNQTPLLSWITMVQIVK